MARQLPVELHGRTASLVPVSRAVARDDHLSGDAVECVVDALSPVEPPSGGDAHLARGRERSRRLEPDRVARTEQLRAAGIGAALKQRVECLEVPVRGILRAARDVADETEARRPRRIGEQMRPFDYETPRANVPGAEAAGLEHRFGVVRPHALVPDTRAEGVAHFLCGALLELCCVAGETQVVHVEPPRSAAMALSRDCRTRPTRRTCGATRRRRRRAWYPPAALPSRRAARGRR